MRNTLLAGVFVALASALIGQSVARADRPTPAPQRFVLVAGGFTKAYLATGAEQDIRVIVRMDTLTGESHVMREIVGTNAAGDPLPVHWERVHDSINPRR